MTLGVGLRTFQSKEARGWRGSGQVLHCGMSCWPECSVLTTSF